MERTFFSILYINLRISYLVFNWLVAPTVVLCETGIMCIGDVCVSMNPPNCLIFMSNIGFSGLRSTNPGSKMVYTCIQVKQSTSKYYISNYRLLGWLGRSNLTRKVYAFTLSHTHARAYSIQQFQQTGFTKRCLQGVCANWNQYKKYLIRKDGQDVQIKFCFQNTWMRKAKLAKLSILHAFRLK